MERKGMKRKYYEIMKNDLCVALHNLTIDSGKYNTDIRAATEDFEQMLRSLADRQADFLTRSLLLEEQYERTIAVVEAGKTPTEGQSSAENLELPPNYAQHPQKFAHDCKTSLNGHSDFLAEEYEQMEKLLTKYGKLLNDNMEDMKNRAARIEDQRSKLSSALHVFTNSFPEDSDEETEDTDGEED